MGSVSIPAIAATVGAGASVAGAANSIFNGGPGSTSNAYGQQAQNYAQQAADLYNNLNTPSFNTQPLQSEPLAGTYTPQTYAPYVGQVYQMSDDPAALASENQALTQMQGFTGNGLNPAELAALAPIQQAQAAAATSQGNTALAQLGAQGDAGAGAAYATQLAANQNAANSSQSLYNTALQNALTNQMNAINSSGSMASNIRGQSANISQAMAGINNQFNTEVQNLKTSAAANAANAYNQAAQYNITNQQNLAGTNTGIANTSQQYGNTLTQQGFANTLGKVSGQANALVGQENLANAEQSAAASQNLGQQQTISTGLNSLANYASTGSTTGNTNPYGTNSNNWMTNLSNLTGSNSQNAVDSGTWDNYLRGGLVRGRK